MESPENSSEGSQIENVAAAETAAYAEKPFRDAELKYREQLTEEERHSLDMIAEKEGEEAIKAFEQTQSLEDPRIAALRALVEQTIRVGKDFPGGEAMQQTVEIALKQTGQEQVDRILASQKTSEQGDLQAKMKLIQSMATALTAGAKTAVLHGFNSSSPKRCYDELIKAGWSLPDIQNYLRGYFMASFKFIEDGKPGTDLAYAIEALTYTMADSPQKGVQEYLPLINQKRAELTRSTDLNAGADVRLLDGTLKKHGFLWSPPINGYIHLG